MNEEFASLPISEQLIVVDEDVLGGVPVFAGTRVPVQTLIDYLRRGLSLEEFFEDFPTVSTEHAETVLPTLTLRLHSRNGE